MPSRVTSRPRRKEPVRLAAGVLALAAVVGGVWVIYKMGLGVKPAEALSPDVMASSPGSVVPPPTLSPTSNPGTGTIPLKPVEPPPVTILQGSGAKASDQALGTLPAGSSKLPIPASNSGDPKPQPTDLTRSGTAAPREPQANPPSGPAPTSLPPSGSTEEIRLLIDAGDRRLAAGDAVAARVAFSKALSSKNSTRADQDMLRAKLTAINDDLIFSPKPVKGDPYTEEYTVQSGDNPVKIARKRELATEAGLIERVNKIDPRKLRVGQKLKLVRGPFHAIVHKNDYRLDLYAGSPDDQSSWTYIRSFKVGLGENNSTPLGVFTVKSQSKLVNPHWVNPRTGEKFDANDPKNPIGERWIGLEGVGPAAVHTGYGLHGTVEPDSIGQQRSMGCVRMGSDDVNLMYELLVEKVSVVKIEP